MVYFVNINISNIKSIMTIENILYVYIRKYESDHITAKINTTNDFLSAMNFYIKTGERQFNNERLKIWKFDIKNDNYDYKTIKKLVKLSSINNNIPYKYFNGDGSPDFYYFDNINSLKNFLSKNNIDYTLEKIDVDSVLKQIKSKRIDNINYYYDNYIDE